MSFWWRWVQPQLSRKSRFWWSIAPLLLALLGAWTVTDALSIPRLSPQQSSAKIFGNADGVVTSDKDVYAGTTFVPPPLGTGISRSEWRLNTSVPWRTAGGTQSITYYEQPLPGLATAGNLTLLEGRWPARPGEIAATKGALSQGLQASVAQGLEVRIVGTVSETFDTDAIAVYAAPGTWSSWNIDLPSARQAGLKASPSLYFEGPGTPGSPSALQSQGLSATMRSAHLRDREALSAKEILETTAPLGLVGLLGASISGVLLGRWIRRIIATLIDCGVDRTRLRGAAAVSTTVHVGVMIVLTSGLCLAAGVVIRALMVTHLDHPLQTWLPAPGPFVVLGGLSLLLTAATLALTLRAPRAVRRHQLSTSHRRGLATAAGVCVGCAVLVALLQPPGFRAILAVVALLAAGAAMVTPVAVWKLSGLPGPPGSLLAARRSIASGLGNLAPQLILGTALLTVLGSTLTLAGGTVAHLNNISSSGIPRGMVILQTDVRLDGALDDQQVATLQRELGGHAAHPIQMGAVILGGELRPTWWLPGERAVSALWGPPDAAAMEMLRDSGTAPTSSEPRPGHILVPAGLTSCRWISVREPPADAQVFSAVVLRGLSLAQEQLAHDWPELHGLSPAAIQTTHLGEPVPMPLHTQLACGLFGLVVALIGFASLKGEAERQRRVLEGMAALGMGHRWTRSVLVKLAIVMYATAGTVSLAAVILAAILVRANLNGALSLSGAPWLGTCLLVISATAGGTLAAWLLGGFRPRAATAS